jgi:hypothetical protein
MKLLATMWKWFQLHFFRYLAMLLVCLALMFIVSCSSLPKLLPHNGTNVAANTQLGQNNSQVLGQVNTNTYAAQAVQTPATNVEQSQGQVIEVRADNAKSVTYNQTSKWLIIVALIGWVLPTPQQMVRNVWDAVTGLVKRPA